MNQLQLIIVVGIAGLIAIPLLFLLVFYLCKHKRKSHFLLRSAINPRLSCNASPHGTPELPSISVVATESAFFDPCVPEVSMVELIEATNNFSSDLIIGDGSFGLVYKAELSNGVTVALKKLHLDVYQGQRGFWAEMETLGGLRHQNIVKILGYCSSGPDRVLIYEFIEKGSLDQWLHETFSSSPEILEGSSLSPLSWNLRVKIIKGVASGLVFMHGLDMQIVHRDIKASNVLLDNEFEAHIADFGLARCIEGSHSHVSTQAAGTLGYMPPEYRDGCTAASVKGDVYNFGILMFEVATGKRPNLAVREDGRKIWMVEWVKNQISENKVLDIVDPGLPRECLKDNEVYEFMKIANLCTSEKPKGRPPMHEVVVMLNSVAGSEVGSESATLVSSQV